MNLGGIGGDHFPEGAQGRTEAKLFVNNDIQAEMVSFLTNERLLKQSDGDIILHVNRSGFLSTEIKCGFHVKCLDPIYSAIKGELVFNTGDVDKTITLPVPTGPQNDEHIIFTIVLSGRW